MKIDSKYVMIVIIYILKLKKTCDCAQTFPNFHIFAANIKTKGTVATYGSLVAVPPGRKSKYDDFEFWLTAHASDPRSIV